MYPLLYLLKIGMCLWYKQKPLQRWPFLMFVVVGFLLLLGAVMSLAGSSSGFVMVGVLATLMSIYGANHFRILLALKEVWNFFFWSYWM